MKSKAISPLLGAVILIAITVTIAYISAYTLSSLVQKQTEQTSSTSALCTGAVMEINKIWYSEQTNWWDDSFPYRKKITIQGHSWSKSNINSTSLRINTTAGISSVEHLLPAVDKYITSTYANLTVTYKNSTSQATGAKFNVSVNGNLLGTLTVPSSQTTYTFTNVSVSWLSKSSINNITYWTNNALDSADIISSKLVYNISAVENYQIAIDITYESVMQRDYDDIRFTYYNSTSESEEEIPYWIEIPSVENNTAQQINTTAGINSVEYDINTAGTTGYGNLTFTVRNDTASAYGKTLNIYVNNELIASISVPAGEKTYTYSLTNLLNTNNITFFSSLLDSATITYVRINYYNKTQKTWVKIPYIPANGNSTVYMYYGNSYATSESNGTATFEFFDDFENQAIGNPPAGWTIVNDGSTDTPKIDNTMVYHGSLSVKSRQPNTGAPSDFHLYTSVNPTTNIAIHAKVYIDGKLNTGSANEFNLKLQDQGANSATIYAFVINFVYGGTDIAVNNGGTWVTLRSKILDAWIDTVIKVDFNTDTYKVVHIK